MNKSSFNLPDLFAFSLKMSQKNLLSTELLTNVDNFSNDTELFYQTGRKLSTIFRGNYN